MSALVPYVAQELANPVTAAAAADLAAEGIKAAAGMFKAHKAKRGRTKKRKVSAIETLGRPAGFSESKRNDRQSAPTSISNKEFENEPLIRVEKDVAADENISKRSRDTLHHKGCKVCFSIKNTRKETVFLNWAIVVPKATNAVSHLDILRGDDLERDQAVDVNATFMDLRCNPINADRYRVIKHKKLTILPDPDKGTGNAEGRDFRLIEEYIKTDRQVFFDGSTATPLQNMFMVWWVDYYGSPTGVNSLTADVSWKIVNYFKEVN